MVVLSGDFGDEFLFHFLDKRRAASEFGISIVGHDKSVFEPGSVESLDLYVQRVDALGVKRAQ